MSFCVKCGKEGLRGDNVLCKECKIEEEPILQDFKDIRVLICTNCGKMSVQHQWILFPDLQTGVKRFVSNKIKSVKGIKPLIKPMMDRIEKKPGKQKFDIVVSYKDEEYVIPGMITYIRCPMCERGRSKYYEAVVQLRDVNDEILNFFHKAVKDNESKGVFITQDEKFDNGYDYYLTSKQFARKVTKDMQTKFGGSVSISEKLFSRSSETSKDIYRICILYKLPKIKKGDIIRYGGEEYRIINFRKKAYAQNIKSGKKEIIDFEDIKEQFE